MAIGDKVISRHNLSSVPGLRLRHTNHIEVARLCLTSHWVPDASPGSHAGPEWLSLLTLPLRANRSFLLRHHASRAAVVLLVDLSVLCGSLRLHLTFLRLLDCTNLSSLFIVVVPQRSAAGLRSTPLSIEQLVSPRIVCFLSFTLPARCAYRGIRTPASHHRKGRSDHVEA